jgi:hypothetical protein
MKEWSTDNMESMRYRRIVWRHPQLDPWAGTYTKRDGTVVVMADYIAAGGKCTTVVAANGSTCKIVCEPPLKTAWEIEREMNPWRHRERNPPRSRQGNCCNVILATVLSCGLGGCNCNENDVATHLRCLRWDTHNYRLLCCVVCATGCCCCSKWNEHAGRVHKKLDVAFYPTNVPKEPKKEEPKKEEMER